MKLVTFARPMAPHGVGDTRLVPDDVAERLREEGTISASEPFPPRASAPAPQKPSRPVLNIERPARASTAREAR